MAEKDFEEILRERKELRRQLQKQWKQAPDVTIAGVVWALGGSTGWFRGEGSTFQVTFDVWRDGQGRIREDALAVQMPVDDIDDDEFSDLFHPFEIVRIQARISEVNCSGEPQALLLKVLPPDPSDSELEQHAKDLQKIVTLQHPKFGEFKLNRRVDWFEAKVKWGRKFIVLTVSSKNEAKAKKLLSIAETIWIERDLWENRVRAKAVEDLLPVHDEHWRKKGEAKMDEETFASKLKLTSIGIEPNGTFSFWFKGGGLFLGHEVCVKCDANGAVGAEICG